MRLPSATTCMAWHGMAWHGMARRKTARTSLQCERHHFKALHTTQHGTRGSQTASNPERLPANSCFPSPRQPLWLLLHHLSGKPWPAVTNTPRAHLLVQH